MNARSIRVPVGALATIFLLGAMLSPAASSPSTLPITLDAPDLEEIALLEELLEWLAETPRDGGFQAFHHGDLAAAIRARPQSFELFRSFHGEEASRELMAELPFGDAIYRAARRHQLDSLLLAAVVETESNFNPRAVSHAGAIGLTQLMPTTGRLFTRRDLYDPEVNLDTGARYLAHLLERYEGDLALTLAAYNAGPGNVNRFGGVPPFRETRSYVRKVLGRYVGHHQSLWQAADGSDFLVLGPNRVAAG